VTPTGLPTHMRTRGAFLHSLVHQNSPGTQKIRLTAHPAQIRLWSVACFFFVIFKFRLYILLWGQAIQQILTYDSRRASNAHADSQTFSSLICTSEYRAIHPTTTDLITPVCFDVLAQTVQQIFDSLHSSGNDRGKHKMIFPQVEIHRDTRPVLTDPAQSLFQDQMLHTIISSDCTTDPWLPPGCQRTCGLAGLFFINLYISRSDQISDSRPTNDFPPSWNLSRLAA
jgi:hypothetical protein